ncbi:glucokinase [Massilia sp. YIM B02769]|uniref:glucokinase n=1 Tax=Massilia sp. YIM B02769 TaxID=3050129 RepID=UPI0025B713D5|nr:glucokinase [Massilia sp. YIM B02769]MDN4059223.1 glucokinase [Massilia sp. YIM B02769]
MHPAFYPDGPRLLADIGGTNARFALERAPGQLSAVRTLACDAYPRFEDAVSAYLASVGIAVQHAAIAIANPVDGDAVRMTNHHWAFSTAGAAHELGLETLLVVNDFTALAMSLPGLMPADLVKVGGGATRPGAAIGLVGAGTGLGVSGLVPNGAGGWTPLQSEGGHVAFSPADEREVAVLRHCWERYSHVSAERLVSGPGLALIREALAARQGLVFETLEPAGIVARGLAGDDPLCLETLECFAGMLGTVAANLAVTLGARGGIYIGGGVVPRLGEWFARSPFRARFEHKGRFSDFTAAIPTLLITAPCPALLGAGRMLGDHLGDHLGERAGAHALATAPAPMPVTREREHAHC